MPSVRTRFPSPAALELAAAGVTQDQVADRTGVTGATVSRQLAGERRLQPETLSAIRVIAGVDTADKIAEIHGIEVSA